ncbi:MAG TPA: hypothetical protein VKA69_01010, partial [Desulfobacteria bacterium]|nr:hypothetical protein [Desulfobacteria bacterium]
HGRQITDERTVAPIIIPMSAFEPPWLIIKIGNMKKQPRLDTVKKLAAANRINDEVYMAGLAFDFTFELL